MLKKLVLAKLQIPSKVKTKQQLQNQAYKKLRTAQIALQRENYEIYNIIMEQLYVDFCYSYKLLIIFKVFTNQRYYAYKFHLHFSIQIDIKQGILQKFILSQVWQNRFLGSLAQLDLSIQKESYQMNQWLQFYDDFISSFILLLHKNMAYTLLLCMFMLISLGNSWCLKGTFDDNAKILSIDGSPNDQMVMTCSDDGIVTIRNSTTLEVLFSYDRSGGSKPKTARWSKNGLFIAVGYTDGDIFMFGGTYPFALITSWSLNGGIGQIRQLDWNANSNKILACGSGGKFRIMSWSNPSYSNLSDTVNQGEIFSCRYGLNERVVVGTKNHSLYVYDSSLANLVDQDEGDEVNCVDFSPDATKVIYSLKSNKGNLLTVSSSSNTTKVTDGDDMEACSYSNDGNFYAFGGKSDIITMFNASSGTASYIMKDQAQDIQRARFSYNSKIFYYGDNQGKVWMYIKDCSAIQASCKSYQYLNPATSLCVNCSTHDTYCARCSSTACTSCASNYYISGGTCLLCANQLKNCVTCDSSIKCNSCNTGYFLVAATSTCSECKQLIPGCRVCNSTDSTCIQCFQNFYRSATNISCIQCITTLPLCIQCLNSTKCQLCIQGYYADSSGVCQSCATNCLVCKNTSYCLQCSIGFYPNSHSCTACPAKCIKCDHSGQCLDCIERTYNNAGTCTDCPNLCLTCNASNYCVSCKLGHYLSGGVCTKCASGCTQCSSAINCIQCQVGSYLSSGNCLSCTSFDSKCIFCNTTQCKACQLGYYLDGSHSCQLCSSSMFNCAVCNDTNTCLMCFNGYYKTANSGNSSCGACNSGCTSCELTDGSKCLSCFPGFYFNNGPKTCVRCANNCETCSSSTTCLSCQNHFYENAGACTECITQISHCLTCFNASYCTECQNSFHLSTNNASCLACPTSCTSCKDASTCNTCQLGYYLNTGACIKCPLNCSQCSVGTICQKCDLGFYLTGGNLCSHCSTLGKNCYTCTNTACLSCPITYVLSTVAATLNQCLQCSSLMPFCLQCTSQTVCIDCFYGYIVSLSGSSCQSCQSHLPGCFKCNSTTYCQICSKGFYKTATFTCSQCIDGCSQCTNSTNCFQCQSGFTIDTSTTPYSCKLCQALVAGCQICDSLTTCTKCLIGSYFVSATNCSLCRSAMSGCLYCNDSTTCISCQEGYYLDTGANNCIPCSVFTGCQYCNSTNCFDCENTFYLDAGTNMCLKCYDILPGCLFCQSPTVCLNCKTSYYLTNLGSCSLCSSQIQGCIACSSANVCLACVGGYYLNAGNHLCDLCTQKGCEICQQANPSNCITCNTGFYLNINQCDQCNSALSGCLECSDGLNCDVCDTGFYLTQDMSFNYICQLCSDIMNACTKCSSSLTCLQCKSMYFLNSTSSNCQLCSQYMVGCIYCRTSTSCLNCGSGFYLNSSSNVCTSCLNIQGCLVCTNQTVCNYCTSQYYLDTSSNSCIKCSENIPYCFSCVDSLTCSSCQGGYTLNDRGVCQAITLTGTTTTKNMKLVTKYVDGNTLKHIVTVQTGEFQQKTIDLTKIAISLVKSQQVLNLTVKYLEFKGKKLLIYTNNPLNVSLQAMPLSRLLTTGSIGEFNWATQMTVDPQTMAQILPSYSLTTDATFKYSLSEPQFYQSYIQSTQTSYFFLFGTIISILLLLVYLPFSVILPKFRYAGRIIPQIFLFKLAALSLFPTYVEYINFGYGFMMVDFPWANQILAETFGYQLELLPQPHLVYYASLSFLSTYLIAFCLVLLALAVGFVIFKFFDLYNHRISFFNFIYNFFIVGLLVASSLSLQGTSINSINQFSLASFSFIIGIIVLAVIVIYTIYATVFEQKGFYKLRIFLKISLLSIAYLNPLFIISAALIWSLVTKILEYWFFSDRNVKDKIFLGQQILLDLSFGLLVFLPLYKIILFTTMLILSTVVIVDIITNVLVVYIGEKAKTPNKIELGTVEKTQNMDQPVIWDMNFDEDNQDSKKSHSPVEEQKKNDNEVFFKTDIKPLRKRKISSKTQMQLVNPNSLEMNEHEEQLSEMHFEGNLNLDF